MDDLQRILDALESVVERLGAIDVKQAENNKDLQAHMKRTELNEEAITVLREHIDESLGAIKKSLEPLNRHLN